MKRILGNKNGLGLTIFSVLIISLVLVLSGCPGVGPDVPDDDAGDPDPTVTQLAEPNPSITAATEFTLTVSWPAVSNAGGYVIQKYLDDVGTVLDDTAVLTAGETEYTFAGLDSNTFYYFRVQVTTTDAAYSDSPWSTLITGRTLPELADILAGFAGDYYYYPEPLAYSTQITKWDISTTPTTISIDRYTIQYQETYPVDGWHAVDTLSYTVTGYSFMDPSGIELQIQGTNTTFDWYVNGDFGLNYHDGSTPQVFYAELDSVNEPYFAYDVDEVFDGGYLKVWYCKDLLNQTYYHAFKADFISHWEFDILDKINTTGSWTSDPSTSDQHLTITSVNITENASRYYGTFVQTVAGTVNSDYVTLEFFSESRADLTFYTDATYTTVKKLGGLTDIIYELHSNPSEIGAPGTLFM